MLSLLLASFSVPLLLLSATELVYAGTSNAANVNVSPSCGSTSGFTINFDATGFEPNGLVHWMLIHSNGTQILGPFGMFKTDENGSFRETTHTERQLPDTYTLHFFEDLNNDSKPDLEGAEYVTTVGIPCG